MSGQALPIKYSLLRLDGLLLLFLTHGNLSGIFGNFDSLRWLSRRSLRLEENFKTSKSVWTPIEFQTFKEHSGPQP